jgi:hypothetical protein
LQPQDSLKTSWEGVLNFEPPSQTVRCCLSAGDRVVRKMLASRKITQNKMVFLWIVLKFCPAQLNLITFRNQWCRSKPFWCGSGSDFSLWCVSGSVSYCIFYRCRQFLFLFLADIVCQWFHFFCRTLKLWSASHINFFIQANIA